MEAITVIAAVSGLVGTLGGLVISYLSLRHSQDADIQKIKIEVSKAFLASPQLGTTKPKFSGNMFTFKIANLGKKDYAVVSIGVNIGKRSGSLYINQPSGTVTVPYVLKPGETCNFWSEYKDIEKSVKKASGRHAAISVTGYVNDYVGNKFTSKKYLMRFKETNFSKFRTSVKDRFNGFVKVLFP